MENQVSQQKSLKKAGIWRAYDAGRARSRHRSAWACPSARERPARKEPSGCQLPLYKATLRTVLIVFLDYGAGVQQKPFVLGLMNLVSPVVPFLTLFLGRVPQLK